MLKYKARETGRNEAYFSYAAMTSGECNTADECFSTTPEKGFP